MTRTFALLIAYGLLVCSILFIIIGVIRERLIPGSKPRYILATIQWALMPPAFLFPALSIIAGRHFTGSFVFLVTLWVFYDLYKSDDDNWWRRKRKQLKQRLAVKQLHLAGAKV